MTRVDPNAMEVGGGLDFGVGRFGEACGNFVQVGVLAPSNLQSVIDVAPATPENTTTHPQEITLQTRPSPPPSLR